MQLLDIVAAGTDYVFRTPNGVEELFSQSIDYRAFGEDGYHRIRIGFKVSPIYDRDRRSIVIWFDDQLTADFVSADDFERTGDVLSEIRLPGNEGKRICRYPDEAIPERYLGLPVVGLPTRINGSGVHHAWSVVANIADHRVMVTLAAFRRLEGNR